jgi:prepilin signal peptidase PulO-like enzyme (type II secretory pathway)
VYLLVIPLFIIGLFIGSFLGVLVDRIPSNRSVIKGRSKCEFCKRELGIFDLIPVFSFLVLRGKCRYCKHKLSSFYPVIELVTGFLFACVYLLIAPNFLISIGYFSTMFFYLFIISTFIVVFFTDLKYGIIPDKIIFPSTALSVLWIAVFRQPQFINYLVSALGASFFLAFIAIAYYFFRRKESMGGGDIKFAFLMGLVLGFPNIVVAFYIAFLTAAAYSIILILWGKLKIKDTIPFGPFLASGTILTLFFAEKILQIALPYLGL